MNKNKIFHYIIFISSLGLCIFIILNSRWIQSLDGDNAPLTYALYSNVAKCLYNGELPLWNPYVWGGFSNYGTMGTQAFYPINWILCLLFYDSNAQLLSYAIIPANLVIHIIIYFSGLFCLLKKINTHSIDASVVCMLSVMTFSISKFFTWIVYFDGFCWLPWFVVATLCLFENKKRGFVGLFFLFVMEALISVSQMLILIVFFLAILLIINVVYDRTQWKLIIKMMFSGILAVMVCFPIILQTLVVINDTYRYVPEIGWTNTSQAVPIGEFYSLRCTLEDIRAFFDFVPKDSWMSLGGIFLILVIFGLFTKREKKAIHTWYIFGFIFALLYCVGIFVPELVYYVPLLNSLREPFMYGCFLNFFASLTAANGLRNIRLCVEKTSKLSNSILCDKVLVLITALICIYNALPHNIEEKNNYLYFVLLFAFIIGVFCHQVIKHSYVCVYILLFGVLIVNFSLYYNKMDARGIFTEKLAISNIEEVNNNNIKEMKSLENYSDNMGVTVWGMQSLPMNQHGLFGLRDAYGYFNPISKNAVFLQDQISLDKRCQLQHIDYFLLNSQNDSLFIDWFENSFSKFEKSNRQMELFTTYSAKNTETVCAYYVTNSLGYAWCVNAWCEQSGMDENQVANWINNPENDLSKMTLIDTQNSSKELKARLENIDNQASNISVTVIERNNNSIKFKVNSDKETIMVSSLLYASGWNVYVNDEKSELLKVDYTNMGAIVPKGESVVEFKYRPKALLLGIPIQIGAIATMIIYVLRLKKNNNKM